MSKDSPSTGGVRRKRSDRPRPPRVYSVLVGVVFAVIIIIAAVSALRSSDREVLGAGADDALPVVEFAVPDARGELTGDANIAQDNCEVAGIPCPEGKERTPACEVDLPGAIRSCDLFDRPLVLSFWFTRGGDCEAQQDVFDAVYRRYSDRVNFLGLNAQDDRDDVTGLIADRGWTHPIGLDSDGALFDLFRVGGCPSFIYAYPGGIVQEASVGELDEAELSAKVEQLLAASAQRAERVR